MFVRLANANTKRFVGLILVSLNPENSLKQTQAPLNAFISLST
jgi:hypothetical protein